MERGNRNFSHVPSELFIEKPKQSKGESKILDMAGYKNGGGKNPLPDPASLTEGERKRICELALAKAEELRRAKRYKEGIDLLVEVLRYGVLKPQVYFRLGNIYFDQGDLSRAEYAYQRAIQEDPKYASAYHNLGVVYRRQGKVDQSVKMLKKARNLEIRYPPKVALSPEERKLLKRLSLPMILIPIVVVLAILLIVYIVGQFI